MKISSFKTLRQMSRYYSIGVLINLIGYGAFLGLLHFGLGAKTSSAVLFLISILISFWVNRVYVFQAKGNIALSFGRNVAISLVALLLNLGIILLFVDCAGMRAEYVQLFSVVFISLFLFVVNKFLVHKESI